MAAICVLTWEQEHILVKCRQLSTKNMYIVWLALAIYYTCKSFSVYMGTCECKIMPLLKGPDYINLFAIEENEEIKL